MTASSDETVWNLIKASPSEAMLAVEKLRMEPALRASRFKGATPRLWAALHGRWSALKAMMEMDASDIDEEISEGPHKSLSALELAIAGAQPGKDQGAIKALLEAGASLDRMGSDGLRPLHRMVRREAEAKVEWLLNLGARTDLEDARGNTPIIMALCLHSPRACQSMAKLLIGRPGMAKAGKGGLHALHWAYRLSDPLRVELIEGCVSQGLSLDEPDAQGMSPLGWSARIGETSAVKLMLDRGANPMRGAQGEGSAIQEAARAGHDEIIEMMLDRMDASKAETQERLSEAIQSAREMGQEGSAGLIEAWLEKHALDQEAREGRSGIARRKGIL